MDGEGRGVNASGTWVGLSISERNRHEEGGEGAMYK